MKGVLVVGAAIVALQSPAYTPEITGARITLVSKPAPGLRVTIENHRDSPLVECEIGLIGAGRTAAFETHGFSFRGQRQSDDQDTSPVQPKTRRVLHLPSDHRPAPDIETATVDLAVFGDGLVESTPAGLARRSKLLKDRRDDLTYWAGVLDLMPRISEADLRSYLATRLIERVRDAADAPSSVRDRLEAVLRDNRSGPEIWTPLDALRADVRRELAAASVESAAPAAASASTTASRVSISWEPLPTVDYAAAIENLRDIPLEAYQLWFVDPDPGRSTGGLGSDLCTSASAPAARGRGPIQPHEVREVPLRQPFPAGQVPRLSFVMFADLSSEGNPRERERLLRDRERKADDYAFMIDAITQSMAMPADEARKFLANKQAERLTAPRPRDLGVTVVYLREYLRRLNESPERAVAGSKAYLEDLEGQRQCFLRHLAR